MCEEYNCCVKNLLKQYCNINQSGIVEIIRQYTQYFNIELLDVFINYYHSIESKDDYKTINIISDHNEIVEHLDWHHYISLLSKEQSVEEDLNFILNQRLLFGFKKVKIILKYDPSTILNDKELIRYKDIQFGSEVQFDVENENNILRDKCSVGYVFNKIAGLFHTYNIFYEKIVGKNCWHFPHMGSLVIKKMEDDEIILELECYI